MPVMGNQKGFAGIVGLLVSMAAVCLLVYFVVTVYMKNPVTDTNTRRVMSEQGINTSDPGKIVDDVKKKVDEATKLMENKTAEM
jgi:hypothetical protein